jgi:hypothetical protein
MPAHPGALRLGDREIDAYVVDLVVINFLWAFRGGRSSLDGHSLHRGRRHGR